MSNYQTVWTIDQIVANFRRGEYADSKWDDPTTVTYGFATSQSAYPDTYGEERAGFSPFTVQQQQAAILAISLWTDVANITITPAADGNQSNLRFANTTTGPDVAAAYMPNISGYYSGDTWVNPNYYTNQSPGTLGGYGFLTLIHEIGHAIGLPHPGDYNGGNPSYYTDALYQQDSRQYTVMSYFNAYNTGANHQGYYGQTPLLDDIAAIQFVYGANMSTRSGDTVYGYHTNITGRPMYDFNIDTHPIISIWDGGGNDTIDLSGSSTGAYLDLNQGAFSDVLGLTKNLSIAYGAVIENAIGTSASDAIIGNSAANTINGGLGSDSLTGGAGNDVLIGGAGIDAAVFAGVRSLYTITRSGTVTISGPDGTDTLKGVEEATFDDMTAMLGRGPLSSDFNRDLNSDILWQNENGQALVWLMNGASSISSGNAGPNPGPTWHVKGEGDFNGDGRSDILWQGDSGQVVIWYMNGTNYVGGGAAGQNPGTSWQAICTGDFNGDGYADILWQNADGTPAIWLMNGTTVASGAALANPGPAWHIVASGDFNGDTKSDILLQNTSGQAAIWLMDGTTLIGGGTAGLNPGPAWHIKSAGDFNSDGKSDILWQNDNGSAAVWFMDGTSMTGGGLAGESPGTSWHAIAAEDFNGDAMADILWQNINGTPAVWLMDNGTFMSGSSLFNPGLSWHEIGMSS